MLSIVADVAPARTFQLWLEKRGLEHPLSVWVSSALLLFGVAIVAFVAHRLTRWVARRALRLRFSKSRIQWDQPLVRHGALSRLSHFVPALVLYHASELVFPGRPAVVEAVHRFALVYMILAGCLASNAIGRALADGYEEALGRERSIRSFVQVGEIIIWVLGGILVIATLADRSPWAILGGFGAVTAVFVLVFREALMGLVASVQISRNDMLRVGDWLTMPKFEADGEVTEILLTTVKVSNWDKTTTMLPSHALIQHPFINWRSVLEANTRRIKRALLFDFESIRTIEECESESWPAPPEADADDGEDEAGEAAREVADAAAREVADAAPMQVAHGVEEVASEPAAEPPVVSPSRTNLGAFRDYVVAYLQAHPEIRTDVTLLARTLPPRAEGLPLEIYCFTRRARLAEYEVVQSDVMEHLVATAPRFGLRLTQLPSSDAVRSLAAEKFRT